MSFQRFASRRFVFSILIIACILPTAGCIGMVANLLNVVGAGLMPAAFAGLEEKKVAVVCVSNSELFGPTSTSSDIGLRVSKLLAKKVKKVEVVSQQKVDDWIDLNGWDMVDFIAIGRGVEADMVVAIDIDAMSLHDGPTMYKGRSIVHIVVYDMITGEEVFSRSPPEVEFPMTAGVPSTSTSEREFRKLFMDNLAGRIARHFYAFDINEDVAGDVETLSRL